MASAFNTIQDKKSTITELEAKVQMNLQESSKIDEELAKSKDEGRIRKLENKKNMLFNTRLNYVYKIICQKKDIKQIQQDYIIANLC